MTLSGQAEDHARVLRDARRGRLHHGLLVEGAPGVGKTTAVHELACALLCTAEQPEDAACGTCPACAQAASGNHPDLHVVTVAEGKHDLAVDQVRALRETLSRRAFAGRARVAILDPADLLNEQAQNALLKTLEEPGARTYLLLATSRPEALLETVRSRTTRLRIRPLGDAEVKKALAERGVGDADARASAAALAGGSVGLALALVEEGIVPLHQQVVAFLEGSSDISEVALARAVLDGTAGRAAAEHRAQRVLGCAGVWLRQTRLGSLAREAGQAYGAAFSPWVDVLEALLAAEEDLQLRIGSEQALCAAFLRARDSLHGGAHGGMGE